MLMNVAGRSAMTSSRTLTSRSNPARGPTLGTRSGSGPYRRDGRARTGSRPGWTGGDAALDGSSTSKIDDGGWVSGPVRDVPKPLAQRDRGVDAGAEGRPIRRDLPAQDEEPQQVRGHRRDRQDPGCSPAGDGDGQRREVILGGGKEQRDHQPSGGADVADGDQE